MGGEGWRPSQGVHRSNAPEEEEGGAEGAVWNLTNKGKHFENQARRSEICKEIRLLPRVR